MIASRKEVDSVFVPVNLTLTTQAEVDSLFAVFNYAPLADLLETMGLPSYAWDTLLPYTSDKRHSNFLILDKKVTVKGYPFN